MKKNTLYILLIMLLATVNTAWGQTNEAAIGTNEYATFEAAFTAANEASGSKTIKLLTDATVEDPIVIPASKTLTFDLNGKTLTLKGTNGIQISESGSSLTIKNGTIDATACSVPSFIRRYILGFENGTVIMENDTITQWSVPAECPDCTVSRTGNTSADPTKVSAVYHTKQYGNFIRHLLADEPLAIDGTEGCIPLSVILGIYESSRTGRRVSL